jgi:hypothetical protein
MAGSRARVTRDDYLEAKATDASSPDSEIAGRRRSGRLEVIRHKCDNLYEIYVRAAGL